MADEVHSPVPDGQDERLDVSSPGGMEESSDDEGDLFTRSYLGLDTDTTHESESDSKHGGNKGGSGGSGPPDDGPPDDGPSGDGPPDSDDDSNDDDDDNDDTKPKGAAGKRKPKKSKWKVQSKRRPQIPGETFDDALYDDQARSWVTLRHTVPGGRRFVQRDRIPPFIPPNDEEINDLEELVPVAYPSNPEIPVPRGNRYDGSQWVLGKDSIYRKADPKGKKDKKKDLVWRPTFVLRLFDQNTGSYLSNTQFHSLFDEVIQSNFSAQSVMKYNKRVRQWLSRNCTNHRASTTEHSPWSPGEIAEAVRYLNSLVHRHGAIHVADNWDEVVKGAIKVLSDYRKRVSIAARGVDSTRTKFKRAVGLEGKLNEVKEDRKRYGKDVVNKQKNFFGVADFRSKFEVQRDERRKAAAERSKEGTKTKKRDASRKTSKIALGADDDEIEDGLDEGGEKEPEEDGEEAEDVMPPPKKKRKY